MLSVAAECDSGCQRDGSYDDKQDVGYHDEPAVELKRLPGFNGEKETKRQRQDDDDGMRAPQLGKGDFTFDICDGSRKISFHEFTIARVCVLETA